MVYRPSVNSSVTYALKANIIFVLLAGELTRALQPPPFRSSSLWPLFFVV